MPIRKFHDISEMEDIWHEPGPELFGAIRRVWEFARRTCEPRFPPGVYKHRSFEAADVQREAWEEANFREFQLRHGRLPSRGT